MGSLKYAHAFDQAGSLGRVRENERGTITLAIAWRRDDFTSFPSSARQRDISTGSHSFFPLPESDLPVL